MFDKEKFDEYFLLWKNFKDMAVSQNRFFLKHETLQHIKDLAQKNTIKIEKDSVFYRARLYSQEQHLDIPIVFIEFLKSTMKDNDDIQPDNRSDFDKLRDTLIKLDKEKKLKLDLAAIRSGFWGYPKGQNLMPPKYTFAKQGRANPQYIPYLYLASSPYTALVEVKPTLDSKVSISKIVCTKDLKIVDFSSDKSMEDEPLSVLLMMEFSKPFMGEEQQYIPTQIITEYIKSEGYDGVKFNSSLDRRGGKNYIFYTDGHFDDVDSSLYEVSQAYLIARSKNNIFDNQKICPDILNDFIKTQDFESTKPNSEGIQLKEIIDNFIEQISCIEEWTES